MGSSCSCPCIPAIGNDLSNTIQETIGESIVSIPVAYECERRRIVDEMHRTSPHPYQDLLFVDYPVKNGLRVNALARRNVTSNEVKKQIADRVNEKLQPEVEAKTADMNPILRAATSKAVEKAVEKGVSQAVDRIRLDNDTNTKKNHACEMHL